MMLTGFVSYLELLQEAAPDYPVQLWLELGQMRSQPAPQSTHEAGAFNSPLLLPFKAIHCILGLQ